MDDTSLYKSLKSKTRRGNGKHMTYNAKDKKNQMGDEKTMKFLNLMEHNEYSFIE